MATRLLCLRRVLETETAMVWHLEGFSLESALPAAKPLPTVTPRPVGRRRLGRALPKDEDEDVR